MTTHDSPEQNGDFVSLSTDGAATKSVSGITVGASDDITVGQKTAFSWDGINWEHRDNPIIDGSSYNGLAEYASYMPGSVFDSPIDDHYIVWATHDDADIHLSTASGMFGSWTAQGSVWTDSDTSTETSSPSWVYVPSQDKTYLYYHIALSGTGQTTRVVEAPLTGDGTSFDSGTKQNVVEPPTPNTWDGSETSYLHVVRDRGGWVGTYQGRNGQGTPVGPAIVHSDNGIEWVRERQPVGGGSLDAGNFDVYSPTIVSVGGHKSILYQDRSRNKDVYAVPWDQRHNALRNGGEKVISSDNVPWGKSSYNIVVEEMLVRGSYLYAIYKSGADDNTEGSIGLARAPLTELMA